MTERTPTINQIACVKTLEDLLSASFYGDINAICLTRDLKGDFSELVEKLTIYGNIVEFNFYPMFYIQPILLSKISGWFVDHNDFLYTLI